MPRVTLSVFVLEDSEGLAGLGWADWADWAGLAGLGWGGVCEEESIDVPLTDHQPHVIPTLGTNESLHSPAFRQTRDIRY